MATPAATDGNGVDAALAPLRARLAAARLVDVVNGGSGNGSGSTPPAQQQRPTAPASAADNPPVACLEHDATIGDALYLLARRRILSAPLVVNPSVALEDDEELAFGAGDDDGGGNGGPSSSSPRPPRLLGWVGLREIVLALHDHLAAASERAGKPLPTHMLALMTSLHGESPKFLQRPLVTLRDADDAALVYQADEGSPLLDAVRDVFCGGEGKLPIEGGEEEGEEDDEVPPPLPTAAAVAGQGPAPQQTEAERRQARRRRRARRRGAHRLAVFDARGALTHVVSQLDVVRFLQSRCRQELGSGALSRLSLRQLGLHPPRQAAPLVTLQPHTPTLFALDRMVREGVNGAAVVGPKGEIVANLSLSDCRCMQNCKDLAALALPVAEFLALSHGTSYLGYSAGARGGGVGGGGAVRQQACGLHSAPSGGRAPGAATTTTIMPPPPPVRMGGAGGGGLRPAGSGGLTPPTFFAAAARAAAARNGGGGGLDSASSISASPPPASPAFGAGGGGGGGGAGTPGAVASTPPGLVRLSSGGISSGAGGTGYLAAAGGGGGGGGGAGAGAAMAASSAGDDATAVADEADHVVRLITASPDATLADVVALMTRHHVHRVYLVEKDAESEQQQGAGVGGSNGVSKTAAVPSAGGGGGTVPGVGRVTGVVTPTDILELLAGKLPA